MKAFKDTLPIVCNDFKTQHGRIPIDPAILAAIGRRFIATKKKTNMPTRVSEATPAETNNRKLLLALFGEAVRRNLARRVVECRGRAV